MIDNELVVVKSPDVVALASEWQPLVAEARALVVDSKESHGAAINGYRLLKIASKRITEHYEPTRAALEKAKKELLRARDGLLAPIDEAMKIVSGKASAYEIEETRRAREVARLAEEAERKRLEDEKLAQAEKMEEVGASSLADAIIEQPVEVKTIAPAPEVAKVEGVSARIVYHAEVDNIGMLIQYVAKNPVLSDYLLPNMPRLNLMAREHKDALALPGVRAVAETVRTVRG
jgi:hypothetical protein